MSAVDSALNHYGVVGVSWSPLACASIGKSPFESVRVSSRGGVLSLRLFLTIHESGPSSSIDHYIWYELTKLN